MIRAACIALLLPLAACGAEPTVTRLAPTATTLETPNQFGAGPGFGDAHSNPELVRDFERLTFELESGRSVPVLSRFEGPITVRLTGQSVTRTTSRDLDVLLSRLRNEAGLNISRVASNKPANISIELVSAGAMHRVAPNTACFVAPNASSWTDFLRIRKTKKADWTKLKTRQQMAVFIPNNVSDQETRDCLHEETAQALGPLNDLYDAHDSIFNDDNFHAVLTGFDMDILRLTYAPELSSGMARQQVMDRLPTLVDQMRPNAPSGPTRPAPGTTPQSWKDAIETALGPGTADNARAPAARWALEVARSNGWRDSRLGFSLYAVARLHAQSDPDRALAAFAEADRVYAALPQSDLQRAHIAIHRAAYALSSGHFDDVVALTDQYIPVAKRGQNAGLLSTLLMIKSNALTGLGRMDAAERARVDSFGWAGYAFTSTNEIAKRYQEISEMVPNRLGRQSS